MESRHRGRARRLTYAPITERNVGGCFYVQSVRQVYSANNLTRHPAQWTRALRESMDWLQRRSSWQGRGGEAGGWVVCCDNSAVTLSRKYSTIGEPPFWLEPRDANASSGDCRAKKDDDSENEREREREGERRKQEEGSE